MSEYSYGWRKFDGKKYQLVSTNPTMTIAQNNAKSYRKQGFNARVVTRRLRREKHVHILFFDVYVRDAR